MDFFNPSTKSPIRLMEWGPEPEKALQQVHITVQGALSFGPYDPADPTIPEASMGHRYAEWGLKPARIRE